MQVGLVHPKGSTYSGLLFLHFLFNDIHILLMSEHLHLQDVSWL